MRKLQLIYNAVCKVTNADIGLESKKRHLVYARFCYFHFAKLLTESSLDSIGQVCGKRDHSTVIYGLGQFQKLMKYDDFIEILKPIEEEIYTIDFVVVEQENKIDILTKKNAKLELKVRSLKAKVVKLEQKK